MKETIKNNRDIEFNYLLSSVNNCNICNRMCSRKKVLSQYNGNIDSKVLFIAEAPGRLGAECTGIPLYGDVTGQNFEMFLGNIGWSREDVFITNAILCNPQDENGNNSTPTKFEIDNCSYYLDMVMELVNPDIVVTLGIKALEAIKNIREHNFTLKNSVAQALPWNNRKLFPLYHMSPRAAIHRSIAQQRADFITLSHIVNPIQGLKKESQIASETVPTYQPGMNKLVEIVSVIISDIKTISFFKLTKLLYLIDLNYLNDFGNSLSGSVYLRMQEGPWIPYLKNISIEYNRKIFNTTFEGKKPILHSISDKQSTKLTEVEVTYIKSYVSRYKDSSDSQMKIVVYRTKPMKYILEQEKLSRNMLKVPVLYKDSTVIEMDKIRNDIN